MMTKLEQMAAWFEQHEGRYLEAKRIGPRDLAVFNKLASMVEIKYDIISDADYEMILVGVAPEELAQVATEDDIIWLIEHGLLYDSNDESFYMHV